MIRSHTETLEKSRSRLSTLGALCKIKRWDLPADYITTSPDEEDTLLLRISDRDVAAVYSQTASHFFEPMYQVSLRAGTQVSLGYVLAVINSAFSQAFVQQLCSDQLSELPYGPVITHVRKLPIRSIDFTNATETELHNELTRNADFYVKLSNELRNSTASYKTGLLYTQIAYHQKRINELLQQLYEIQETPMGAA